MAEAYRYFDVNFNNRVSFNEFQKGLDHLKIKFQVNQVDAMFKYLDRDQKGYISFGDFSELCEEKRRQLDPFDHTEQDRKNEEADAKKNWVQKYLDEAHLTDLDEMSKRQKHQNILRTTATQQLGNN